MLHQRIESMWWNKREKPNLFLKGLSVLYQQIARWDQAKRLSRAVIPSIPMISVGNITVGGSGKTPFVLWLAEELKREGFSPVLLSRGDGANNQEPHLVTEYSKAREIGDEAVLLQRLSGCPVIAGRDRIAGANMAKEHGDILILDDGFQYRQLARVCDIVLVPSEGVGNGCLLPAGPLRETVSALQRADVVVRSGDAEFRSLTNGKEWHWSAKPSVVRDWNNVADIYLEQSQAVQLVTGVARAERVAGSLEALGFEVAEHTQFADHFDYSAENTFQFYASKYPVVTTAKDAVKLLPLWPEDRPLWVLEQRAEAEQGLLENILQRVKSSS